MEHVPFVHLHVHTEYSLLEGMCRIPAVVRRAHELKMPALAITDHGNLFGAAQFYRECMHVGIKPILGCELYVVDGDMHDRPKGASRRYERLLVLAQNETGWRNLMRLSSKGYLEGFYYKPRIDKALLRELAPGLIALTSTEGGAVPGALKAGQFEFAERAARELIDIFGADNVFLELQDHGRPIQREINAGLAELSETLGLPCVVTNDAHYVDREEAPAWEVLLAIGHNTTLDDPRRWRPETDELYLKSYDEMRERFQGYDDALHQTVEVANRCNVNLDFETMHLPKFAVPDGRPPAEHLRDLCEGGLPWRYGDGVTPAVRERLEHELGIISRMGFAGYFLVVHDFVREARERGIPVGPGRGSAAGSIVSYLLGITGLDPLPFGLIFERFLNPDRISMPDIDIDFCYERRGEIISYVTQKYGADSVSQIITFGQLKARAVIRDVGRAMGMPFGDVDRLAKLVPNELNIRLTDALDKEPELKRLREEDPDVGRLFDYAIALEGLARHASTHAAGVVICEEPLDTYVPLFRQASSGDVTSQWPMGDLEAMGLLKMDFLGLRTLTVMAHAVEDIRARTGRDVDLARIPLDDAGTYAMLSRADCIGVFQMESSGMRDLARKIGLEKFEDIIALVALFRPGPMNMLDDFIARKHGKNVVEYDDPRLEPILAETHGIMLYQEQVMRIAVELAGFTLAESDTLRKAMGKKLPDVMQAMEEKFVGGAVANGCPQAKAEKVWHDVMQFAGYGFNKSHSAAYGLIAYQTAWLKHNYPTEYMAAVLTSEMNNTDKLVQYLAECARLGIRVLPPDVNESVGRFRVVGDDTIRYGLAAVKNVGEGAIRSLVEEREAAGPYTSIYDFCRRVDLRHLNRRVIDSLILAGAMDGFGRPRRQLLWQPEGEEEQETVVARALQVGQTAQRDRATGQTSLLDMLSGDDAASQVAAEEWYPDVDEWPEHTLLQHERDLLGIYLSGHPLGQHEATLRSYVTHDSLTLQECTENQGVTLGGLITNVKEHITRRGDKMAWIELEDLSGTVEVTVFPSVFPDAAPLLQKDQVVFVQGHADPQEDAVKLKAARVLAIEDAEVALTDTVLVTFITAGLESDVIDAVYDVVCRHPGECRLLLRLETGAGLAKIETPYKLRVAPTPELRRDLEPLVGADGIAFQGRRLPPPPPPRRRPPAAVAGPV